MLNGIRFANSNKVYMSLSVGSLDEIFLKLSFLFFFVQVLDLLSFQVDEKLVQRNNLTKWRINLDILS